MTEYRVTSIRLPAETLKELKLRAVEESKSVAQLVRESIALYLGHRDRLSEEYDLADDPFFSLGAGGHSGLGDDSVAHDRCLYPAEQGKRP